MQLTIRAAQRSRRAFTLIEVVLVLTIIALLAALLLPVFNSVRRRTGATACISNLRQVGIAANLYYQDYGLYPDPPRTVSAVSNREVLFCPDDDRHEGLASSYAFRALVLPAQRPYWTIPDLDPAMVLMTCRRHTGVELRPRRAPASSPKPDYPYLLVLRAGGSVQPIALERVREVPVPGNKPTFARAYPGEPGYDMASR